MERSRGVTIVELLTILTIIGIVSTLAVPGLTRLVEQQAASSRLHLLHASLNAARLAAITQQMPVTVCPSADGERCRPDLDWSEGWIIYLDQSRTAQPGAPGHVLRHVQEQSRHVTIQSTTGRHRIRFQPSGLSGGSNISLRVCTRVDHRLLGSVVVNNTGRTRSTRADGRATPCPPR